MQCYAIDKSIYRATCGLREKISRPVTKNDSRAGGYIKSDFQFFRISESQI